MPLYHFSCYNLYEAIGQGVWDTLCSLRGHSWVEKGPTNGVICHVQLGQGGIIHGLSL